MYLLRVLIGSHVSFASVIGQSNYWFWIENRSTILKYQAYLALVLNIIFHFLVLFQTDSAVTSPVFAHVCHVMTFVPADCKDQLFVLALDLVTRPLVSNDDVSEQLRLSINSLSSEVYKAALLQKLYQNL